VKTAASFPIPSNCQTDGKILVFVDEIGTNSAGAFITSGVLRYTSGGVLDSTFGKDGIVVLPTAISAMGSMAVQSNEQIVVAGLSGFDGPAIEVQRLNTNGSIDNTFGTDGLALAVANANRATGAGTGGTDRIEWRHPRSGATGVYRKAAAFPDRASALHFRWGLRYDVWLTRDKHCDCNRRLHGAGRAFDWRDSGSKWRGRCAIHIQRHSGIDSHRRNNHQQRWESEPSAPSVFQPNSDYLFADELFVGEESRAHNSFRPGFPLQVDRSSGCHISEPELPFRGQRGQRH
jgi:hypothetical protein